MLQSSLHLQYKYHNSCRNKSLYDYLPVSMPLRYLVKERERESERDRGREREREVQCLVHEPVVAL